MIKFKYKNNQPERLKYEDAIILAEEFLNQALAKAHKEIKNITYYISKTKGKGIRTKVLLASAIGSDGLISIDAAKAAAAVEVLHLATLVHDDVIDDAETRRGADSVQKHFGKRQAVISGDYLFCLAYSIISNINDKYAKEENIKFASNFANMVSKICIGELKQFKNIKNIDLNVLNYLRIISGKTASLFSLSSYAGGIISESDEREINLLLKYGNYLGMLFQIIDDCKDYEFTETKAQKSVKKDIEQGFITIPLILTLMKHPHLKDELKDVILGKNESYTLVKQVCELGGIEETINIASKYFNKAENILKKISNKEKSHALMKILHEGGDSYLSILQR